MTCGSYDADGHENHFCHNCRHVSFLGSRYPNRPCKTCLDIGNCHFE